jgi:hypothetical protein
VQSLVITSSSKNNALPKSAEQQVDNKALPKISGLFQLCGEEEVDDVSTESSDGGGQKG